MTQHVTTFIYLYTNLGPHILFVKLFHCDFNFDFNFDFNNI